MRTKLRSKVTLLFIVCAALLAFGGTAMALVTDTSGNTSGTTAPEPTIQSDKADYAPGELVTLTGSGWKAGESVNIKVNDTYGASWSRNVNVTADASGNVTDSFNLPDWFVSDYDVTATGAQSGTATTTFTDSVDSVTITSPTSANQTTLTSLPGTVTVNFNYVTSTTGTTTATAEVFNASGTVATATKDITPGGTSSSPKSDSIGLSVPAGTANDNYNVRVQVNNSTGSGANQKQDNKPNAVVVNVPAKQNQTITFDTGTPTTKTFGNADFNVSATATSGLTVSYAAKAGSSCTVSNAGLVSLTGAGTCTVVASQAGNASYNAAPNVEHAISVGKATPTITWSNPAAITYPTALSGTQLNATAQGVGGGNLAGNFVYNPASDTVLNAGTHQLNTTFTPTNTTDYTNANANVSLNVNKASQTINFAGDAPTTKTFGDADFNVSATGGGSGNPVTFAAKSGSNCTVSNAGLVHITGAGTCTVVASQAGNDNYLAAPDKEHAITINKATPTITWSNPLDIDHGTALSATQLNAVVKGVDNNVLDGNSVYTPAAGTVLNAGTQTLKVDFTPSAANAANYIATSKTVQIVVKGYSFGNGFYQPVDNRILNGVKGGSTVPMKFELFQTLSGNELKSTSAIKTWFTTKVTCGTAAAIGEDAIEEYTTGNTSLRFDTTGDQFILNWQAPKASPSAPVGTCYQVTLVANDGSTPNNVLTALYKIR
jgi:hypothetical protein